MSQNLKYRNKRLSIYFFLVVLSISCDRQCEAIVDFYDNGNKKVVLSYPDCTDKNTYLKSSYHDNGQISSRGFITSGLKNGLFKRWSVNGVLLAKWQMQDNLEVGLTECWYENGNKKSETNFKNGKKNGNYKAWDENGKLVLNGDFKEDRRQGAWTICSESGNWKIENYNKGKLHGVAYEYIVKQNDTAYIAGHYRNGKEDGLWKWFNEDSLLVETIQFKNGKHNGEHKMYYSNGNIKIKGYLKDHKYDGNLFMYDSIGNTIKQMTFDNGKFLNEKSYR